MQDDDDRCGRRGNERWCSFGIDYSREMLLAEVVGHLVFCHIYLECDQQLLLAMKVLAGIGVTAILAPCSCTKEVIPPACVSSA